MGARGPKAKPAELKLLEGNRGHRPVNLDQLFRPEVGVPDAPKWLMPGAKKAWRRLSAELVHYNLISKVDRDAFAMLCQTIGRLELLETSLMAKQALLIERGEDPALAMVGHTPNGMQVQGVVYQMLNKEQSKLMGMLESFGLRPDARAKVTTAIRAQLKLFDGGGQPAGSNVTPIGAAAQPPSAPQSFADF